MATRDTYTTQTWENLPSEETPLSAERLAHIEQGIKDAADKRALKGIYDDDAINFGRKSETTVGYFSVAEGSGVTSSGYAGHAEGMSTLTSGTAGHAEGAATESHGYAGHAEGSKTIVRKNFGHAEGLFTISNADSQHVQGKYNVEDINGLYAHIVGGGTSETDRKNIHTIDWEGNAYYSGDVTNGVGVSLNSLKSDIDNLPTGGGIAAKVFDTKADLDAWLAVEGNAETLVVGQNIYIKAVNTPDYWWDGTGLQVLETDKVEIESMTYDETMAILNATAEEVA